MTPLKLETKYFTLEIFRRGIVFTVASLLLASGINLTNGNIFLALISIVNKQVFKENSNEYGFFVGCILIVISLFLFYLIIINWRIEIYSKTFIQLRKCLHKFATAINYRKEGFGSSKLQQLHTEAYEEYLKTIEFLNENQTNLDIETYDEAVKFNAHIGTLFPEFAQYIKELNKLENKIDTDYNPSLANKELPSDLKILRENLNNLVSIIKDKEKFKLVNNN